MRLQANFLLKNARRRACVQFTNGKRPGMRMGKGSLSAEIVTAYCPECKQQLVEIDNRGSAFEAASLAISGGQLVEVVRSSSQWRTCTPFNNCGERIGSKKSEAPVGGFKSRRVLGDGDCEVTGDAHGKLTWGESVPPKTSGESGSAKAGQDRGVRPERLILSGV